jgi:hypothetical protein
MTKLPFQSESKVNLPQVVRPYGNGKIPKELLLPCGIRNFTMVEPAARACRAMVTAAAADGIRLDATGTFRSYDQQVQMFTQRYSKKPIAGRKTKKWNGETYWQKPGVAMAASPGTSKHGLGVTADLAQRSTGGQLEPVGTATLEWLAAHGPEFGFWNSVKSEAWHWPYFPGDDIPSAVLQMEKSGMIRLQPAVPSDPTRREAFYRELPFGGVLSKGSRGPGVEAVQWALTRASFGAGIDGDFGPATERAVREFQAAKKLTVDGLVGLKSWSTLGLLSDAQRPQENATPPPATKSSAKKAPVKKASAKKPPAKKQAAGPQQGAMAAAAAAYRAGFRGDDLADITMIAGRESRWRADSVNPRTSDRGMWQINWKNLQSKGYDDLSARLDITTDTDLLDLDVNAAVAFFMYEDSVRFGKSWFPWRGSEIGHDGSGPGWDPNGSHTWHTDEFASEAAAAAKAVIDGGDAPKAASKSPPKPQPEPPRAADGPPVAGVYTVGEGDADGFVAIVGRCLGITEASWALRSAAAEAVAEHNGIDLDHIWQPGDIVRVPPSVDGIRTYTVQSGDGMIALAKGLGLGRGAAAQKRAAAINAWQGVTPHPGVTWYGGAA